MSLPARDDVDPEYRFDLTRIFQHPEEWEAAREELLDRLDDLRQRADQSLDQPATLRDLLAATEECHRRKQRLQAYATLARYVATDDAAAADRTQRLRALESSFGPAVAAVHRRLRETDDDHLDELLAALEDYGFYARNLRAQATHTRPAVIEETIAAFESTVEAPSRVVTAVTSEDFDPPSVERPDGETVDVGYSTYGTVSHPDRDYRRRVYEAYYREVERFEHALARTYAEKLNAAATIADVREYDSIRDRELRGSYPDSGLSLSLPESVHDTMLSAVRENLAPYHRAFDVRRERLGVESLRPWDLGVPLTDADPTVEYETARDLIVDAVAPLGDEYADRVEQILRERRVDVYPTRDKRTDLPAACPSSATDGAFVFANFGEDVRTTFSLVHELGHAMNVEYHRSGPARYATNSEAICEVPSILHELLLAEHLLERGGDLAAAARDRLLNCVGGNLYSAAKGSAFAHRTATLVEGGDDLTPGRARDIFADLLAAFRAPVDYRDDPGRHWFGWGRHSIYNGYQYVLGATGALVVRDRLRDGSLSPGEYREFLADTGREQPVSLFRRLGCDVTTTAPFERAATAFDGYVDAIAE
jgi:oligoendopeptidase F